MFGWFKKKEEKKRSTVDKIVMGAIIGTAVGSVIGLTVAPKEGKETRRFLKRKFKKSNGCIVMFGAGHLSVAFISIMGIADLVDFVIDDNPHKKGMVMPIGGIEILGSDSLYSRKVDLCLLGLNPQNQPKIITKHILFTENGGKFASIFPGTALDLEKII